MKRVRLVVAYDGTNYCGWQIQSNGITIEEVLNKALSELLREPVVVTGASRTDSGVHAEGNVAVFDTENRMPADRICFALNQRLPGDVRVLKSEEVAPDWHPRKHNCVKTYEYKILNRKIDMPTLRLYTHFCYVPLDVEAMKAAAVYLVGEHDFKSFCTVRSQAEETVRTIYSLTVEKTGDVITIRVSGSGFLYNMVRIIAGTLMKAGMGVYPPEHVEEIIYGRDRQKAGPKVAAKGLTLISLDYETQLKPWITGENKNWKYRLIQTEIIPKKKAYLVIDRCSEADYDRLLTRVTHQAVRNGAQLVYACDKEQEGRIVPGKAYGYYTFEPVYDMLEMRRPVSDGKRMAQREPVSEVNRLPETQQAHQIRLVPVEEKDIRSYCCFYNRLFFEVPGSATMTEELLKKQLMGKGCFLYWINKGDDTVGFLVLKEKEENTLEIHYVGIVPEFRNQGLAGLAFQKAEAMAAEKGMKELVLQVADSNQAACRSYQKSGFQTVAVISRWYLAHA